MNILLLLIVGLIAGALASALMKSGGDWLSDLFFGVLGSFLGSWIFGALHIAVGSTGSLEGLIVQILVAMIGAVILIAVWRLIHRQPVRG